MTDPVRLEVPPTTDHVGIARVVAAGVATAAGFDYEECEDLRIAVDECCVALLGGPGDGPIRLVYRVERDGGPDAAGTVVVEGRRAVDDPDAAAPAFDVLSAQILAAVVDHYEVGTDHPDRWFRVVKSRPTPT